MPRSRGRPLSIAAAMNPRLLHFAGTGLFYAPRFPTGGDE
jgi:hypothetical protein